MATFTYTARTQGGELKTASVEANSRDDVITMLRKQRLSVIKVDSEKPPKKLGSIGMRDIVVFTRQFSTMINAGLPLVQALDILSKQSENKALQAV
ncbi:MAG TPA: type II secretion system F family protein, partial [Gemmatimonadaceae bacterium]|nr:type II secretion system F family protein [Gemmatimonadaceae bacterium]